MDNKDSIKMDEALWKIERNISMLEYVFDSIVEGTGIRNQDTFEGAVYEILLGLREGLGMAREVNEAHTMCAENQVKANIFLDTLTIGIKTFKTP